MVNFIFKDTDPMGLVPVKRCISISHTWRTIPYTIKGACVSGGDGLELFSFTLALKSQYARK